MIEVYRLEEGVRTLRLFHGGWLLIEGPASGIQLTADSAYALAAALVEWADGEEWLSHEQAD